VSPTGYRTHDRGEGLVLKDVQAAIKIVLQCLVILHAKGFVHRDLRWANLIRLAKFRADATLESSNFLVIDFEFAAVDGDCMSIGDYIHRDVVPYGSQYCAANDLQLVGKLVKTWAESNGLELDSSALDFVHSVTKMEEPLGAKAALQHTWLQE
jgi:hypothetical protein